MVRDIKLKGQKYTFEVYTNDNAGIKSCKQKNGQLVEGHHGSFVIAAESKEEMESWIGSIQSNIASNPLFELIKKKKEIAGKRDTKSYRLDNNKQIDFQELHDACLMCAMVYKSPSVIKVTKRSMLILMCCRMPMEFKQSLVKTLQRAFATLLFHLPKDN